MYSSKTHDRGQKLADRGNQALSQDAVKLLKTQDAGYLKVMAQQTKIAREKMERAFVLRQGKGIEVRRHGSREGAAGKIVYVDSKEDQKRFNPCAQKSSPDGIDESPAWEDVGGEEETATPGNAQSKSRRVTEAEANTLKTARVLRKKRKRDGEVQSSRWKALKSRENDLLAAERELELQRAKMSSSIGGTNKAGVKWKVRERKR